MMIWNKNMSGTPMNLGQDGLLYSAKYVQSTYGIRVSI